MRHGEEIKYSDLKETGLLGELIYRFKLNNPRAELYVSMPLLEVLQNAATSMSKDAYGRCQIKLDKIVSALNMFGGVVAGGAVLALIEDSIMKDIDMFFPSVVAHNFALEQARKGVFQKVYENKNATAFNVDGVGLVEIINRVYGSAPEIIRSFDFSAVKLAIHKNEEGILTLTAAVSAAYDISVKRLTLNGAIFDPKTTLSRVARYGAKGYTLSHRDAEVLFKACQNTEDSNEYYY